MNLQMSKTTSNFNKIKDVSKNQLETLASVIKNSEIEKAPAKKQRKEKTPTQVRQKYHKQAS